MRRSFVLSLPILFPLAFAFAAEGRPEPIRWREWGAEAFEEAARTERPILLWIGARWSEAAARMEREVLVRPDAAHRIHEWFVPVKVDRDRRPDVDVRYQQAVLAFRGSAGWPLTVFLTPEGRVIWRVKDGENRLYGGTFLSLDDDYVEEREGLCAVLFRVADDWRGDRAATLAQAKEFDEQFLRGADVLAETGPPPEGALGRLAARMAASLDPVGGGFGAGEGPKYPAPRALELALVFHARTGEARQREAAVRTLDAMLAGGIHDQLAGGFHRISTDRRWRVPRFEKLLADNAELILLLVQAWQATGEERYAQAAQKTIGFWLREMRDPRGGFHASRAADAGSTYYTWTLRELEAAVPGADACELLGALYDIRAEGDLPDGDRRRNVLFQAASLQEAASAAKLDLPKAHALMLDAQARMLEARQRRSQPATDRTVFVDANARMASALLAASEAFGRADLREIALKTLRRLLDRATEVERGAAHYLDGDGTPAFLGLAADEASLAFACQDAYAVTGDAAYLRDALAALARLEKSFTDADGGYLDRAAALPGAPPALGRLSDPYKPFQDTPAPSANALAALAHLRMAALTGKVEHAAHARKTLHAFGPLLEALSGLGASLPLALDAFERGIVTVAIEGDAEGAAFKALWKSAHAVFAPHKLVVRVADAEARARLGLGEATGEAAQAHVLVRGKLVGTAGDAEKLAEWIRMAAK